MKAVIKSLARSFGYEVRRYTPPRDQAEIARCSFRSDHYVRGDLRRLEHLASLGIPVAGKSVLDVGAGIGDHSTYYLDRGCRVVMTDARSVNLDVLSNRFPGHTVGNLNLEDPQPLHLGRFDVIHCYGVLYHLADPSKAIAFLAEQCNGLMLVETCVSFGAELALNPVQESRDDFTQSFSGVGCRPTRPWIIAELRKGFPYVYCTVTQPNHEDFPVDWTAPQKHKSSYGNIRAVFVASMYPLHNDLLTTSIPEKQPRQT